MSLLITSLTSEGSTDRYITEDELYQQQQPYPERRGTAHHSHRTNSMADYFGRPINLNTSVQSSLMDEISDEWETRSEVARL